MLIVAFVVGGHIYSDRVFIDESLGRSVQAASRYLDSSFENFFVHATFLFGLIPAYSYRTPLPDWSIGLEVQFYLVFPLIAILANRYGWLRATFCALIVGVLIAGLFKILHVRYPMSSFLPLKFHIFAAGMLVGAYCSTAFANRLVVICVG